MKKSFLYLAICLFSASLYSAEPLVKFYLNDGSTKQYNIADIENINFKKSNLSFSMSVFQKVNNLKTDYDIREIDSIRFGNSKMIISFPGKNIEQNLREIDSIIFVWNTCTEIKIGNQVWMCKNLDVDKYRNGDSIPEVRNTSEWANLTTGAWCYYNNSDSLGRIYGKLYNWFAVNDPRGLAPVGWHVPTDEEWKELEMYLGMTQREADNTFNRGTDEGSKLKEVGTSHWIRPNTGATNSSGFSALPGGCRSYNGNFSTIGGFGYWWSSTVYNATYSFYRYLCSSNDLIVRVNNFNGYVFSVRCVKD